MLFYLLFLFFYIGVGGGAFYVPIFVVIFNVNIKVAIVCAVFMIVGAQGYRFIIGYKLKNSK